jgi:hypothetical protein
VCVLSVLVRGRQRLPVDLQVEIALAEGKPPVLPSRSNGYQQAASRIAAENERKGRATIVTPTPSRNAGGPSMAARPHTGGGGGGRPSPSPPPAAATEQVDAEPDVDAEPAAAAPEPPASLPSYSQGGPRPTRTPPVATRRPPGRPS